MNVAQLNVLVQATKGNGAPAAPAAKVAVAREQVQAAPPPAPVAAPAAPQADARAEAGREAIEHAVQQIRQFLQDSPADIQFSLVEGSNRVMLQIVDGSTKEVLIQVPSEVVLQVAQALDRYEGLFISDRA